MESFAQILLYLAIALAVLLFFGPIVVIISIIGDVELGPVKINFNRLGRLARIMIGILGLAVWLSVYVPLVLLAWRTSLPPTTNPLLVTPATWSTAGQPLNMQLTTAAWNALAGDDYLSAIEMAEELIDTFEGQALREQREFTASGKPAPVVGAVSEAEKNEIFSRGVLNDVATCYFIKGRALEKLNHISEAKEAYTRVQQFPDARLWDSSGNFWSLAQMATDRLAMLP